MSNKIPDWELEARRVALAFGFCGECQFRRSQIEGFSYKPPAFQPRLLTLVNNGLKLQVTYSDGRKSFSLRETVPDDPLLEDYREEYDSSILLINNGTSFKIYEVGRYGRELARVLFHLDLLPPWIEVALGVCAHDKMEWTLEHKARFSDEGVCKTL